MIWLYNTFLYQPLYNLLIFLYNSVPGNDLGAAIIILTILIKIILFPLSAKSIKAQKSLQDLQPQMQELQKKHKGNKEQLAQATMKLYKDNKVNPLSSCFPLLLQFPFLIAVYHVFRAGVGNGGFDALYPFVANPGAVNVISMGFLDLSQRSLTLAVLAGLAQYLQTQMLTSKQPPKSIQTEKGAKDESIMAEMNKSMKYFMPFLTIIIGASFPAGLTLYWFLTTILTVIQQKLIFNKPPAMQLAAAPADAIKTQAVEPAKLKDQNK